MENKNIIIPKCVNCGSEKLYLIGIDKKYNTGEICDFIVVKCVDCETKDSFYMTPTHRCSDIPEEIEDKKI